MDRLYEIISSIINVPVDVLSPVSGPENIPEWDSLALIGIVAAVEDVYGVQLTMPEILAIKKIEDLYDIIKKHGKII